MHDGVLKGPHRTDREIAKVKFVLGFCPCAEFPAAGAAVGRPKQPLTACIVPIIPAVGRSVRQIPSLPSRSPIRPNDSGAWAEIPEEELLPGRLLLCRKVVVKPEDSR
jgi:hypothetical protein